MVIISILKDPIYLRFSLRQTEFLYMTLIAALGNYPQAGESFLYVLKTGSDF